MTVRELLELIADSFKHGVRSLVDWFLNLRVENIVAVIVIGFLILAFFWLVERSKEWITKKLRKRKDPPEG